MNEENVPTETNKYGRPGTTASLLTECYAVCNTVYSELAVTVMSTVHNARMPGFESWRGKKFTDGICKYLLPLSLSYATIMCLIVVLVCFNEVSAVLVNRALVIIAAEHDDVRAKPCVNSSCVLCFVVLMTCVLKLVLCALL